MSNIFFATLWLNLPSTERVFISSTAWAILNLKSWNIFQVSLASFPSGATSGVFLFPSRFRYSFIGDEVISLGGIIERVSSGLISGLISSVFSFVFSVRIDLKYLSMMDIFFSALLGLALSLLTGAGSACGVGGSSSQAWRSSSSSSLLALYLNDSDVFGDFPKKHYCLQHEAN